MTIASECIVAGELGLAYAAVCVVDNLANGIGARAAQRRGAGTRPRGQRGARLASGLAALLPGWSRWLRRCALAVDRRHARRRDGGDALRGGDDRRDRPGGRREPGDETIDAAGAPLVPPLVNGHTHAAMTLFRGYGGDLPLMRWLREMIWPVEAKLEAEDVYWGTRLACLEMIRSGTARFWDMYWHPGATARAVADAGLRATIGGPLFDTDGNTARDAGAGAAAASRSWPGSGRRSSRPSPRTRSTRSARSSLRWTAESAPSTGSRSRSTSPRPSRR